MVDPDQLVRQDREDFLDPLEQQVFRAPVEDRACQDLPEAEERLVFPEEQGFPDPKAQQGCLEEMDSLDLLVSVWQLCVALAHQT